MQTMSSPTSAIPTIQTQEKPAAAEPKKTAGHAFGRVWQWLKDNHKSILISTISAVAIAGVIAGLTALTIAFPQVMVPIYIGAGVLAAGTGVLTVALFAGFAVGGH
jgi:hypothetical protein